MENTNVGQEVVSIKLTKKQLLMTIGSMYKVTNSIGVEADSELMKLLQHLTEQCKELIPIDEIDSI